MTKRLVSFDNEKPDLGLPDAVQGRMDARYSGIGETPRIGPNGNWWVGENDTGTPAQGDQGPKGDQGIQGPAGADGIDGVDGEQGPKGDKGDKGEDGRSVTITGTVATVDDLPQEGSLGEGYLTESDGHLHIWGDFGWVDVGEVRGPQGIQGPQGDPGDEGPRGPEGPKGDTGPAGTTSFLELDDVPSTFPPDSHNHSEYATTTVVEGVSNRVTTLEDSHPIIVSSMDPNPIPGRIYIVME